MHHERKHFEDNSGYVLGIAVYTSTGKLPDPDNKSQTPQTQRLLFSHKLEASTPARDGPSAWLVSAMTEQEEQLYYKFVGFLGG